MLCYTAYIYDKEDYLVMIDDIYVKGPLSYDSNCEAIKKAFEPYKNSKLVSKINVRDPNNKEII